MERQTKLVNSTLELLGEFGLRKCVSVEPCYDTISNLKLRQLDKLKSALSRLAVEGLFAKEFSEGIRKNDFRIFSLAVLQLNAASLENTN